MPSLPPGRRHATPAARRSTAPFTWASIAPFAVPPHVTRASPLAPHCHQSAVASWHWATPRHARLATPRRIICHTQVNLTECRPSRPCDGERDREHKISAASSGDAFVQHSILAGTISAASSGTLVFHQRERNISAASSGDHVQHCMSLYSGASLFPSPPPIRTMTVHRHGWLVCCRVPSVYFVMGGWPGLTGRVPSVYLRESIGKQIGFTAHGTALLFSRTL